MKLRFFNLNVSPLYLAVDKNAPKIVELLLSRPELDVNFINTI